MGTKYDATKSPGGIPIFIVGSCVSRDPFALVPSDDFALIDYIARTSLASAFAEEFVLPKATPRVASKWQQRMLECDCRKLLPELIARCDWQYMVVDLIDERFDLVVNGPRAATKSVAFAELRLDEYAARSGFKLLPLGDKQREARWREGWLSFCDGVKCTNPEGAIILNKVKFVYHESFGARASEAYIERTNYHLGKMYEYIEANSPISIRPITYDPADLELDLKHKWGSAPFHYSKRTCEVFVNSLRRITK